MWHARSSAPAGSAYVVILSRSARVHVCPCVRVVPLLEVTYVTCSRSCKYVFMFSPYSLKPRHGRCLCDWSCVTTDLKNHHHQESLPMHIFISLARCIRVHARAACTSRKECITVHGPRDRQSAAEVSLVSRAKPDCLVSDPGPPTPDRRTAGPNGRASPWPEGYKVHPRRGARR